MYLSNATLLFQNNNAPKLNNPFTKKAAFNTNPSTTLEQVSNQIITKQNNTEKLNDVSKNTQIKMDIYQSTVSSSSLDELSDDELKVFMELFKQFATTSERYSNEMKDFKEQLQAMDKTIQEYQDIIDGNAGLKDGQTIEDIIFAQKTVKQEREEFIEDGLKHFKSMKYDELVTDKSFDGYMNTVLGENKFSDKTSDDYLIDPSSSDIYADIDRVIGNVQGVTIGLYEGIGKIYDELVERGYEDKYKSYLNSWYDEKKSYFDKTEEMTIEQMMIDRIMKEPVKQL